MLKISKSANNGTNRSCHLKIRRRYLCFTFTNCNHAMQTNLSEEQINFYRENGYVVIEDFLGADELEYWREVVTRAVRERNGLKMPGKEVRIGEDDGIN